MNASDELERRIADLEARHELLRDVVLALADHVGLENRNFTRLALLIGLAARELDALHEFMGWAVKRHSAKQIREIRRAAREAVDEHEADSFTNADAIDSQPLTREEVVREYEARMPRSLQGKLEMIMRAHQADGNFKGISRIVLGNPSDEDQQGE